MFRSLLGNIVISKKFLRTRKIMVMHSNERGECFPRTLVERKRKRYDNAVDVVVCLHEQTYYSQIIFMFIIRGVLISIKDLNI